MKKIFFLIFCKRNFSISCLFKAFSQKIMNVKHAQNMQIKRKKQQNSWEILFENFFFGNHFSHFENFPRVQSKYYSHQNCKSRADRKKKARKWALSKTNSKKKGDEFFSKKSFSSQIFFVNFDMFQWCSQKNINIKLVKSLSITRIQQINCFF